MDCFNKLFVSVIKYGLYVRKNNLDGLQNWKKIKSIFGSEKICDWNIEWSVGKQKETKRKNIYDYVRERLKLYGEEDEPNNDKHKISHDEWPTKSFLFAINPDT